MMRVISGALVSVLSLALGCAQADHRPASSSQGSNMTLGGGDTGDTTNDDGPTTTVPTTGISASATNGSTDADTAETAETATDTQASADDSSTGSTTTGEDSTGTSDTNPITASDTDGTTGDETTRGVTTDGDPTDPTDSTNGGCNHPPGLYGDCLNSGFLACNNNEAVCIHDDVNNPSMGVCSLLDCEDVCDCPVAPATGNAQVACSSAILSGGQKACVLACGQQTTCPNGMTCWQNTFCVFQ